MSGTKRTEEPCPCGRVHALDGLTGEALRQRMTEWVGGTTKKISDLIDEEKKHLDTGSTRLLGEAVVSVGVAVLAEQLTRASAMLAWALYENEKGRDVDFDEGMADPVLHKHHKGFLRDALNVALRGVAAGVGVRANVTEGAQRSRRTDPRHRRGAVH